MKIEKVKIDKVFINENNPRFIRDAKFQKLVNSIKEFPKMLEIRPIVVNDDMVVLGGNMRLKACEEAGLKEVFIIKASELTPEEQNEFIIKDNVSFGEWDFDLLANNFETPKLEEWGVEIHALNETKIDVNDFFNEQTDEQKENKNKITLEYTEEDYNLVIEAFNKLEGSKEAIIFKLLGL